MCHALHGILCTVKRNSWGQEGGLKNQRLRGKQETKLGIPGVREEGIFYGATQSITHKCTFLFLSGIIKKGMYPCLHFCNCRKHCNNRSYHAAITTNYSPICVLRPVPTTTPVAFPAAMFVPWQTVKQEVKH